MRDPSPFGKYLQLDRLAVGGMAEVFVAKAVGEAGFERLVAIKKILPTMGEDAEFVSMFVDEARIAVQLSHANIVQVLDLGRQDDRLYIAMEYVSGLDLRQMLERYRKRGEPPAPWVACAAMAKVCEALDYAHRKRDPHGRPLNIVHRDVSPQNVLLSFEGEVKLIDFGIAKAESRLQRTQAGILKGKFAYMSPEQVRGEEVDRRSDIFAAGIVLWELLTAQKLFVGESDLAVLERVKQANVQPPSSVNPRVPPALDRVVLQALSLQLPSRYQWASEFKDALAPFARTDSGALGSRELADYMREEFRASWERESERLRRWADTKAEGTLSRRPRTGASDPRIDARAGRIGLETTAPEGLRAGRGSAAAAKPVLTPSASPRALARALAPEDVPTLPLPLPSAPAGEQPTLQMDGEALVRAERELARRSGLASPSARGESFSPADGVPVFPLPPPTPTPPGAARWGADALPAAEPMEEVEADEVVDAGRPTPTTMPSLLTLARTRVLGLPGWLWTAGVAGAAAIAWVLAAPGALSLVSVDLAPRVPAEVRLDGRELVRGLPPFSIQLPAGDHRLEVRAEGYRSYFARFTAKEDAPLELRAVLVSEPPSVPATSRR